MSEKLTPVEILNDYSRRYPGAWAQMERFRQGKGDFADRPSPSDSRLTIWSL